MDVLESAPPPVSVENKSSIQNQKPRKYKIVKPKSEPLTTKKAVELLLAGNLRKKVCRFCLQVTQPLSELEQILSIAGKNATYDVTIRDIVASFYPFKIVDDENLPNKICNNCLNLSLKSYLFTQQCEQSERALLNCFDDIYEKFEKLDPIEPKVKKRGRQKIKVNHNILYTEHRSVIDYAEPIRNIINTGSKSYTKEPMMGELECRKCWQVLPTIESLANHEKSHPKSMWYNCRLCGQSTPKLYLFKRHLKNHLRMSKLEKDVKDKFECKQCGAVNEDYMNHLQHLEKHKFQKVLECLLEKKMENLCAVCLEVGLLTDLDKTITFHGGYPELSGDRSLVNIIGTSVPERHSTAKYQELHAPHHANVMSITKRIKSIHQNTYESLKWVFKLPRVIDKQETIKNVDRLVFLFAKPLDCYSFEEKRNNMCFDETNETVIEEMMDKYDEEYSTAVAEEKNDVISSKTLEKEIDAFEIVTGNNVTLKNKNIICDVENSIVNNAKPKNNSINNYNCDFCWVFKSVGKCEYCKADLSGNTVANNTERKTVDDIERAKKITESKKQETGCKSCWVFKAVGICHYCNKDLNEKVTLNNEIKFESKEINVFETRKRKTDDTTCEIPFKTSRRENVGTTVEKNKWKCDICLTINSSNKIMCICCENTNKIEANLCKVNLGLKRDWIYSNISNKSGTGLNKITDADEKINDNIITDPEKSPNNAKEFANDNKTTRSQFEETDMIETSNDITMDGISSDKVEDTNNFNDEKVIYINKLRNNMNTECFSEETMDFEENDFNSKLNYNTINITHEIPPEFHISNTNFGSEQTIQDITNTAGPANAQIPLFTFNIGSVSAKEKDKKLRNRLKRMHPSLHK